MIEMCDVSKTYGKGIDAPYALKHVSFHMESGEQVCLTGKSGSGKSTFLNLIGAMDMPSEGQILFDGNLLSGSEWKLARHRRENIGYIFQSFYLLPALTVRENITMPMHINRKKLDKEWMAQIVTELGIKDKLSAYPLQLSGGQQQRVAIARAIIYRPKLILADEPTGNLDSESAGHVMRLLRSSINQLGTSLLLVTHDEDISTSFCRVLRLKDGKIISDDKRTVSDDG